MYNFAPTFCPPSSWLHKCYSTEFSQKIKMVVGIAEWGTCARTVPCSSPPHALAYCNNTIATGSSLQDIIILDILAGSQIAILSGHTECVQSLIFSSDGTLLVSGSSDKTVKLWDIQTGGVIRTLCGHKGAVQSVSISANNTMIASGSDDMTIRLWNIKTGDCCIIEKSDLVNTVTFSPTNSQFLLSSSGFGIVEQWNMNGQKVGSQIPGSYITFSPDGTQFVSCNWKNITIRDTSSRMTVMEFNLTGNANHCCFSPDGRFIAAAADSTIQLWDITGHSPYLVQVLIGHAQYITSLVFSSSLTLISSSLDNSIKFWQISASSADPDSESTPLTSAPITSVSLQAKDGLAFSIDSEGVVKTWDIITGGCKKSYETQAKDINCGDTQLIGDGLIIVWCTGNGSKIHIWDSGKDRLQMVDTPCWFTKSLRITEDGSRVLQVDERSIRAWSISTGESAGKEKLVLDPINYFDPLVRARF